MALFDDYDSLGPDTARTGGTGSTWGGSMVRLASFGLL